jgi:hypothetical protein
MIASGSLPTFVDTNLCRTDPPVSSFSSYGYQDECTALER